MEKTRKSGSIIELNYVTSIIGSNDKVLRRKVRAKLTCDVDDIKVVDYYFNSKGELDPTQCKIYHEPLGWMVIDAPYEKLHELKMTGNIAVAGFQQKKERNKTLKNYNKYGRNYQIGS